MGDFGSDPSLPLQDETLGGLVEEEHEVEGDQPGVRFEEPGSLLVQIDESHAQHGNSTWQVDGSNQSLASNKSVGERIQGLTMRDYEEQLNTLRKENFNLKLRIYFMEENKGLLHGTVEQENLYRINIDLKVEGEELKKELQDQQHLLAEAARAIQSLEEKYKHQVERLEVKVSDEKNEKNELQNKVEELENKLMETKLVEEVGNKGLSEESRFLYDEAFGSFNAGQSRIDDTVEPGNKSLFKVPEVGSDKKNKINSELEKLQEKNKQLMDENGHIIESKVQLLKEMEQFGEETEKLNELKEQLEKENEQLRQENTQLKNNKNEKAESNSDDLSAKLKNEIETLLKEKNQLELDKEQRAREKELLEQEKEQLEDDLLETNEENERFVAEIQNKNSQISELKNSLDSLRNQIADNLEEMRTQTETITEQEQEINALTANIKKQSGEGSEIEKLKIQVNQLESQQGDNLKQIVDLKRKLSDIDNELRETETQNESNALKIEKCNEIISNLESELRDRNVQVCGFLDLLKKVKSMKQARKSESLINNDVIDLEDDTENVDIDVVDISGKHVEDALMESKEILEYILQDSSCIQSDTEKHLEYAVQRVDELESLLAASYQDLESKEEEINNLKLKMASSQSDRETENRKIIECAKKIESFETNFKLANSNLKKAHICIQGFVKENLALSEQLKKLKKSGPEGSSGKRSQFINQGIDRARSKFDESLKNYRGRYDKLRGYLKQRDTVCEMLRIRMEELAHFLSQLLDNGDDTLNMSALSLDLRESIQTSIEQSLILSASIINTNSIIEEEVEVDLDDFDDEWKAPNISYEPDQDESITAEPNIRRFSEGTLPQRETDSVLNKSCPECHLDKSGNLGERNYETLLVDLRDALRKRREAEDTLQLKQTELEILNEELAAAKREIKTSKSRNCDGENIHSFEFLRPSTPLEKGSQPSLLPVPTRTDGSGPLRRSPSLPCKLRRSSSLPRPRLSSKDSDSIVEVGAVQLVSRIPRFIARVEDEDEDFSEPDKEESRRRMGIICSEKEQQTTKQWFRGGSEEEGTWERSKIEKLRKEKETLNLELSLVEKEKVNLESKVSKIKSDLGTAELIIRELSTELKTVREKNDELKRKYNHKSRPRLDGEDGRSEEENQNSINELELRVKGQSEALSDLKLQLEKSEKKYNKEKSALVKRCEELESLVGTEKARVESIWELEKTEMGRTLANLRNQVVQLENHKLMKESLEKEFNLLLREKESWDSEKLEYDVNLDKLEEKLTYRNRILEQAQSEVLQLKSQISELRKKLENIQDQRSNLSSEISTLNQKLSVSEEKLKRSERSTDEHENLFSEYKQKCEGYEVEVEELRRIISTKESLIIQLEAKLNKMTAELNDKKSTLKSKSTTDLESQADEIKSLKEQLTDAYSARTRAEQKLTEAECSKMSLQERLERQQKTTKILEERCYSTETILRKITIDNGIEKSFETEQNSELDKYSRLEAEKENPGRSRHELEMALHKRSLSRPGSRQVLTSIDMNSKSSTKNVDTSFLSPVKEKLTQSYIGSGEKPRIVLGKLGEESTTGTCCSAKSALEHVSLERDAALSQLSATRAALRDAADKISRSNRRKQKVEKAIVDQLSKTRTVLRKAQDNLEGCSSENN